MQQQTMTNDMAHWDMFLINCSNDDCDGRCYPLRPEDNPENTRIQCHECGQVYQIRLEDESS